MRISVIDTQEKILTKVLMLKGEKGDKGDAGELTNLDTALSTTSTNAVQNKVITNALNTLLENSATNSFTDGIDSYFKKVVSSIVPVQAGSGTPSPTNVRAISGFTECAVLDRQINQWDEDWEVGDINRTTGQNSDSVLQIRSKNYIPVSPDTSYYIGLFKTGETSIAVCYYDAGKNFISAEWGSNRVRRVPINCYYIRFTTNTAYGTTYNNDISINYPATETAYHAYNGTTATISFGSAGTVYGGYVDLISGKLTVDRAMVDLGSLTWGINSYGASSPDIMTTAKKPATTTTKANLMCEQREVGSFSQIVSAGKEGNYIGLYTDGYISINTTETDATAFKTAMDGVKLVYELATPQTYQLTPAQLRSLVGTNNLTSSTGEVTEVEYIKNETIAWLLDLINA